MKKDGHHNHSDVLRDQYNNLNQCVSSELNNLFNQNESFQNLLEIVSREHEVQGKDSLIRMKNYASNSFDELLDMMGYTGLVNNDQAKNRAQLIIEDYILEAF